MRAGRSAWTVDGGVTRWRPSQHELRQTVRKVAIAFLTVVAACVPHVGHSPRVEPGTRYFISGAIVHSRELQNESFSFIPSLYAGAARGWLVSEGTAAFSLGFQVPIYLLPFVLDESALASFLAISYLDFYVQPRRGTLGQVEYGIGTLLSTGVAMPYVQVGKATDGGVYTTQALAVTHGDLNSAKYWMPTIAYRFDRREEARAVDIYANAAIRLDAPESEWFVGFGLTFELRRE